MPVGYRNQTHVCRRARRKLIADGWALLSFSVHLASISEFHSNLSSNCCCLQVNNELNQNSRLSVTAKLATGLRFLTLRQVYIVGSMALPKRCLAQFTTLARHTSKRHALPSSVKIVEVGPRDGLQNEPKALTAQTKIELVNRLSAAGLSFIEAGSFVGKGVPAMQGSADVIAGAARRDGLRLSALTPNMKGFEAAAETKGLDEVAVFGAASGWELDRYLC